MFGLSRAKHLPHRTAKSFMVSIPNRHKTYESRLSMSKSRSGEQLHLVNSLHASLPSRCLSKNLKHKSKPKKNSCSFHFGYDFGGISNLVAFTRDVEQA